jgi:glycosyltransferase involved in cell wall biosynthesis
MDGSSAKLNKAIVILTPGFPADESDSSCIPALQDYVSGLHKKFPDLKIIVLAFQYPFKKGWYKWNGIDIFSAGGQNRKYFFRIITWFKILSQLKKIYREDSIQALHSFWLIESAFIAQWFAKRKTVKHIATLFGQDALAANRYLRFLNFERMTIIANSEFTAQTFFNSTNREANKIIPFGLNMNEINAGTDKIKYDVVGVGSLAKIKNYDLFIDIIAELAKTFPELKSLIIGEGDQRTHLQNRIDSYKLEHVIELKGSLSRPEVFQYLDQSKIFLHTSSYESSCHARLEALAFGCSVVSFDNGYLPKQPMVHVCRNKEEMIFTLQELLKAGKPLSKPVVNSINETVTGFHEIYF